MKTISKLFMIFILAIGLTNCEEYDAQPSLDSLPAALSFDQESDFFGVGPDVAEYELVVQSTNTNSNDIQVSISVNFDESTGLDSDYNISSNTITIPAGELTGSTMINFDYDTLTAGIESKLVLDLVISEGDIYNITRKKTSISYAKVCPFNTVYLDIIFDGYASECTWDITDSTSTVVASGGPWSDGDASYSTELCLLDGDYIFNIYDAFGDGLSYPANGSASLTFDGNELVYIEGDYGYGTSQAFSVGN